MLRRVFAVLAFGAFALAPAAFAQPDTSGLPQVGIENPKDEPGDLVLRFGFTFARSDIPAPLRMRLDAVAALLTNERAAAKVDIGGHTDSVGKDSYNRYLSEQRAASVKAYLVAHGVEEGRIRIAGYGSAKPRATNERRKASQNAPSSLGPTSTPTISRWPLTVTPTAMTTA